MTKAQMETAVRNEFLTLITNAITEEKETDALPVSANEIAVPCLDPEGNEIWAIVKVSIPRGTRNGNGYDPYDGYAAAEDYKAEQEEKAAKRAASAAKKEQAAKLREAKREAKQVKRAVENLEKAVQDYNEKKGE